MIVIIDVACSKCKKTTKLLLPENKIIKIPFLCLDCFNKKEDVKIRTEKYQLGIGGDIVTRSIFLGYQLNREIYDPLIDINDLSPSPLSLLFSEN